MVDALSLVGEELGHRRVILKGAEQLHVGLSDFEECFFHPVGLDSLTVFHCGAEHRLIQGDGGIKVVDRNGHVVNLG